MAPLGRHEAAIGWADKWVTTQRLLLDAGHPGAALGLAEALRHLAALHVEVGHREAAIAAATEAIDRYEEEGARANEAQIAALRDIAELTPSRRPRGCSRDQSRGRPRVRKAKPSPRR